VPAKVSHFAPEKEGRVCRAFLIARSVTPSSSERPAMSFAWSSELRFLRVSNMFVGIVETGPGLSSSVRARFLRSTMVVQMKVWCGGTPSESQKLHCITPLHPLRMTTNILT
jgi:hypothetical protein